MVHFVGHVIRDPSRAAVCCGFGAVGSDDVGSHRWLAALGREPLVFLAHLLESFVLHVFVSEHRAGGCLEAAGHTVHHALEISGKFAAGFGVRVGGRVCGLEGLSVGFCVGRMDGCGRVGVLGMLMVVLVVVVLLVLLVRGGSIGIDDFVVDCRVLGVDSVSVVGRRHCV